MTQEEITEILCQIIEMQNGVIKNLAAALHVDLAYNDEVKRIERLKKKLEV